jgi:hypothetical protein
VSITLHIISGLAGGALAVGIVTLRDWYAQRGADEIWRNYAKGKPEQNAKKPPTP